MYLSIDSTVNKYKILLILNLKYLVCLHLRQNNNAFQYVNLINKLTVFFLFIYYFANWVNNPTYCTMLFENNYYMFLRKLKIQYII